MKNEVNIKDAIIPLHIISLLGQSLKGRTRLQKLVFLSQQRSGSRFDFEFVPAQFGPLSYKLNHTLERMKKLGLVEETTEYTQSANKVICYSLTHEGKELLDFGISKFIDLDIARTNEQIASMYGNMPYVELLDYVHTTFPQYVV